MFAAKIAFSTRQKDIYIVVSKSNILGLLPIYDLVILTKFCKGRENYVNPKQTMGGEESRRGLFGSFSQPDKQRLN